MQPFQCDLQPQIQETHRPARRNNHSLQEHREGTKTRNQNDPSRNRRTQEVPFIAACSHFTRKNKRFRAPASSPKQSPCNIHAAITMRFAASRRKPARIHAHSNKAWQQSCSHSNAICKHGFKKLMELRTQEQQLVAKQRIGTKTTPAATAAHRRYLSSPATATWHRKHTKFRRLPTQNKAHATFMQPLYNAFRSIPSQTCTYLRT